MPPTWNFIYGLIWIPHHGKIADTRFFLFFVLFCFLYFFFFFSCPKYLPFCSYAPLKKSEWNLMHAISYEPCMLGFWNFIYRFLMEKIWPVLFSFLFKLSPFMEFCPFEKIRVKSWQQDISKSIQELETWSADRGWWVNYLVNFWTNSVNFIRIYGPLKISTF